MMYTPANQIVFEADEIRENYGYAYLCHNYVQVILGFSSYFHFFEKLYETAIWNFN